MTNFIVILIDDLHYDEFGAERATGARTAEVPSIEEY
jgi:hypothetical protein